MDKSSLKVTDEQSAEVQKTPNRVTLQNIEQAIEQMEQEK